MKRLLCLVAIAAALVFLSGCARPPGAMLGIITQDVTEIQSWGNGKIGPKTGTACTKSILGLLTSGDSGIKAAASNGGITQVNSVDYSSKSLLGITGEHCTIVYGN